MLVKNLLTFLQMIMGRDSGAFLKKVNKILREDPSYSTLRILKAVLPLMKIDKLIKVNGMYYVNFTIPPIPSESFMTYLKSTRDKGNLFSQHARLQKSAPATMCLAVTDACSYKCYYCSNEGKQRGNKLTTAEWINIIKDVQDMNTPVIFFTGGEALKRNDLEELVSSIDKRSVSYLLTSGHGLTRERALSLKESGLFGISVSLNSYLRETDNRLRGREDAFDNAVNALKTSVELGFFTSIVSVIPRDELKDTELFKLFDFSRSLGVREIILKEPIRTGRLYKTDKEIFYNDEDRKKLTQIQREANRRFKDFKVTSEVHVSTTDVFGCVAGIQHSYISSTGELFPCDFAPLSFGNVREKSIKDLWNEMNTWIGKPNGKCLAEQAYYKLKEMGIESFPADKAVSCKICSELSTCEYPAFYRKLQGE
ncbi:MAG: radical SAM protein [Clostridiaceae bacterium]|nr:radical SAM protein [Clostridiaceae bacterium]